MSDNSFYYGVKCPKCGWIGSSEESAGGEAIADTGDYSDIVCPRCPRFPGVVLDDAQESDLCNEIVKLRAPSPVEESGAGAERLMREALKDAAQRGFNMGMTYMAENKPAEWPAEILEKIVGWTLGDFPLLGEPREPAERSEAEHDNHPAPESPSRGTGVAWPTDEIVERAQALVGAVAFHKRMAERGEEEGNKAAGWVRNVYTRLVAAILAQAPAATEGREG